MAPLSSPRLRIAYVYAAVVAGRVVAGSSTPVAFAFTHSCPLLRPSSSSSSSTKRHAEAVGKIVGRRSDEAKAAISDQAAQQKPSVPGLPSYLDELSVGDEFYRLRESTSQADGTVQQQQQQPYAIERVSQAPPIYVLRNFVSEEEAQTIAQSACLIGGGMEQAETYADNGNIARPNSTTAFLSHDASDNPTPSAPVVDALSDEVGCWLLDAEGRDCWAEPMQVVRYGESGQFVLHHDSCNRVSTALYFLNGVGGTWFPLADDSEHFPRSRDEAVDACRGAIPGRNGLLVMGVEDGYAMNMEEGYLETKQLAGGKHAGGRTIHIQPGDAIAFYNLRWMDDVDADRFEELAKQRSEAQDPIAVPDWRSFHSGLPVEKGRDLEKWIANHWFHIE